MRDGFFGQTGNPLIDTWPNIVCKQMIVRNHRWRYSVTIDSEWGARDAHTSFPHLKKEEGPPLIR